jgi:Family of unknown function (DUF5677)
VALHPNETTAEARARDLVALVREHVPLTVPTALLDNPWPLYGPALVVRMAGTVEAMVALRSLSREADPLCLLRVLYEHVVTFAWLAINPTEHVGFFRREDAEQRLKADNDCRGLGIEGLLRAEVRSELEALCRRISRAMPDVTQRALEADKHWSARIPEESARKGVLSLREMYTLVYRHGSAFVHVTEQGLHGAMTGANSLSCIVDFERPPRCGDPVGLAGVLLGFALFVSAECLRWPTRNAVIAVFDKYDVGRTGG